MAKQCFGSKVKKKHFKRKQRVNKNICKFLMREVIVFFKAKIYNAFKRNHQMEFLFLMGMKKKTLKIET